MLLAAWIFIGVFFVFGCVDTWLYCISKYPQRSKHWFSLLPGGGLYAFLKYGRDR
jgi:hypothetical protein